MVRMEQQTVRRSEEATELATRMVENDEVMRSIISETLQDALDGNIRESGRTKCPAGGEIRGPLGRFPRAIDLAPCPREVGGTWHTHVTPREIRTPVNSLPDMANVVFGLTDVSVVPGTQTADVVVSADSESAAETAFQNAVGLEASGPEDVVEAIRDGRIDPNTARSRAREALEPLVFTIETGYSDLGKVVNDVPPDNWAAPHGSGMGEEFTGNRAGTVALAVDSFDEAASKAESQLQNSSVKQIVFSTAVGTIVGNIVDSALFD